MIEPPDGLPADACPAWCRITNRLEELGAWHPAFMTGAFVASTQAAAYLTCCRLHGPAAALSLECRAVARAWLVDMLWLSTILGELDSQGWDADLLELCRPIEDMAA